jgi:hypothetical protein
MNVASLVPSTRQRRVQRNGMPLLVRVSWSAVKAELSTGAGGVPKLL